MTKEQAKDAVSRYASRAWPTTSKTFLGAIRAAWAQSHIPNISLELFRELLESEGYRPVQFGGPNGPWIIQLPGRPPARLSEGQSQ